MNITPALINTNPLPADPDRSVAPVRPPERSQDALADAERRHPAGDPLSPAARERLEAKAHSLVQPLDPRLPKHAQRALSSYASVSEQHERSDVQSMLGFDDYA